VELYVWDYGAINIFGSQKDLSFGGTDARLFRRDRPVPWHGSYRMWTRAGGLEHVREERVGDVYSLRGQLSRREAVCKLC